MTDYIKVKGNKVYCTHTGRLCPIFKSRKDLEGFEGCACACDIPIEISIENRAEMYSWKEFYGSEY
jgi:hypothetical protein